MLQPAQVVFSCFTHQGRAFPMKTKLTKVDISPIASVKTLDTSSVDIVLSQATFPDCPSPSTTSAALPPSPPSPSSPSSTQYLDEFGSCAALLLSQKLRNLELQTRETEAGETRRSALDPSCLLTPPNTPHVIEPVELVKAYQDKGLKCDSETLTWSSDADAHDEGGLVFECLAALKVDHLKSDRPRFVELKEEEEEQEEQEAEDHYNDNNDEVFSLELERGERGLGLALVDTRELRGESSTFQLPEEEESLLSLLYQVSCVHGPGQVRCDVDAQELDIVDTLNCFPVDEERSVLCPPGPPVVHYDLLGLAGVQNKVVVRAPLSKVLDLLSVVGLIIVRYEAHYGGVVCKLYDGVCGVDDRTVTGEESEEGFTDTSLRVKGIFIRAVVPDSPAARCERLVPGDRILAVNGVSLLGLDYQSGKELIQSSGDRLRLLVARSEWMAKAIQSEC
ncbi:hypothetical protein L3Q82_010489 [Scortum barcoo]|uniref:Uncharacterized protein n=1 Tax=Scortum barcoo TaxID=214431 RepID=A0ACB8WCE9_9TELE|nr:hypothetical protein L3Q82_010489 [Scortum barcoo]